VNIKTGDPLSSIFHQQKREQEELLLAQEAQGSKRRRQSVDDVVDPVLWTVLTSSKNDFGDGGASTDHEHQQRSDAVS
jgi:hypothetical protein